MIMCQVGTLSWQKQIWLSNFLNLSWVANKSSKFDHQHYLTTSQRNEWERKNSKIKQESKEKEQALKQVDCYDVNWAENFWCLQLLLFSPTNITATKMVTIPENNHPFTSQTQITNDVTYRTLSNLKWKVIILSL